MYYLGPSIWDLKPNEKKNLNILMSSNSKSKDGSLKNVHAEYAQYILGRRGLQSIKKKTGFEGNIII